jgi:hypothetical protein
MHILNNNIDRMKILSWQNYIFSIETGMIKMLFYNDGNYL